MSEGYTPEINVLGIKGLTWHVNQFCFAHLHDYIPTFPAVQNQQHDKIQVIKDSVDPEN